MKQWDKLYKQIKRSLICTFLSVLLVCAFFASAGAEDDGNQRVVRVAYVLHDGYQEGKDGEIKTGYGYEYLQKIRSYTGWKYEYVYGSFKELLKGVEEGKIDLMGNISKTDERLAKLNFGSNEQGREDYVLVIRRNGSPISKTDLSTLEGKRIGVAKGTIQINILKKWLTEHNYRNVKLVEFSTSAERFAALNNGIVDALLNTHGTEHNNWVELVKVGDAPYYFVTNKQKVWLKEELDRAQQQILVNEPDYNYDVRVAYSNFAKGDNFLTVKEQRWINAKKKIRVGYIEAMATYAYTNERGLMQGVFQEILGKMSYRFSLQCDYQAYKNYMDMIDDLKNRKLDVVLPVYGNKWFAEKQNILLTDDVSSIDFVLVTLKDKRPDYINKVAVSKAGSLQPFFVQVKHPHVDIVWASDLPTCVKMVNNGEVDGCYISSTYINGLISNDMSLRTLEVSNISEPAKIAMGVREDSAVLVGIINKTLAGIPQSEITDSIIRNARSAADNNSKYTFIRRYKEVFFVLAISLIIIFGLVAYGYYDSRKKNNLLQKQKEELEKAFINYKHAMKQYQEADYDRRRDFLTGLCNRQEMFDMLQKVVAGEMPPIQAMFMMDIDDYKSYNDNYGHVAGDEVLKIVGKAILDYVKTHNMEAYRYGGEEILLAGFAPDMDVDAIAQEIVELIRSLNLQRNDVSFGKVTISLGYTKNNHRFEKMIYLADVALYKAKAQGKNQAVEG